VLITGVFKSRQFLNWLTNVISSNLFKIFFYECLYLLAIFPCIKISNYARTHWLVKTIFQRLMNNHLSVIGESWKELSQIFYRPFSKQLQPSACLPPSHQLPLSTDHASQIKVEEEAANYNSQYPYQFFHWL
jgi:hypothetical protein